MPLEGIAAVQARIGEIRRLVAPPALGAGPSATASATGTAGTAARTGTPPAAGTASAFDAVLAAVAGPLAPVGATTATAAGTTGVTAAGTAGTGALAPAVRATPGSYGRLEPPAELLRFGNGRIPAAALDDIGGGHRLHAPAAGAFERLRADAEAAGVTVGLTDSYRDYESQVSVAARKGLYSEGGLAARPGTSTHGWGLSVDLRLDAGAQRWMREHAWRYGFVEDVPREPWHWTYRPAAT